METPLTWLRNNLNRCADDREEDGKIVEGILQYSTAQCSGPSTVVFLDDLQWNLTKDCYELVLIAGWSLIYVTTGT